ncbi:MAG TPA: HAMP domain-containing sensor histidine kinase [Nocardioides sp.]|nr:HAMP domain-containing sensor histidine kinase [Nocardioides sp.]
MKRLPLRANMALLAAATTAAAIVAASVLGWLATRHTLREQVDSSLGQRILRTQLINGEQVVERVPQPEELCQAPLGLDPPDEVVPAIQLVRVDGTGCANRDPDETIVATPAEREVAEGERDMVLRDAVTADGTHVRTLTTPLTDGYAVRVSRSLEEVDATMRDLTLVLGLVAALGVLVAGGAGLAVARIVIRPVDRLTEAAEHVAETEDLDVRIDVSGRDEVARLSKAFNAMTERLSGSRRRQRQLIADAGHELRTPLTSLRTNLEWLMRSEDRGRPLTPQQRRQVEQAVLGQVEELGTLVGELVELARGEPTTAPVPVDLDAVVLRAVERAQHRARGRRFDLHVEPWRVRGDATALERAVLNLLDNALKFSDGAIRVRLEDGRLTVDDTGPGLDEAEREHAFERFWRAPTARELPGSGLGLAIVADAVERHGGDVFFGAASGGGSRVGFSLPSLTELSADVTETHTAGS